MEQNPDPSKHVAENVRSAGAALANAADALEKKTPPDPVDEARVRDLVREAVTHDLVTVVVKASVKETLLQLGIDSSNPIEMQKDFIHLREWRRTVDGVRKKTFMTATTVIVTGILGMIAWSFKDILHLSK